MLKVLLTVDTELWPRIPQWPDSPLSPFRAEAQEDYDRCILGRTSAGEYGLPFLLETLRQHDLKAVFFVEALFASAVAAGNRMLERTIELIHDARQEVQLHVHTEWLSDARARDLPEKHRQNLRDFNIDDQFTIIRHSLGNLRAAGALEAIALRAGNMGGNRDTLFAARRAGLVMDMSLDPSQEDAVRSLLTELGSLPANILECPTIPLSCVRDYPCHYRPAQLTALSFRELRHALLEAARQEWPEFVILLHSFELISSDNRTQHGRVRPHAINISRWNKLCSFLSEHRERFVTIGCAEVDLRNGPLAHAVNIPRTPPVHTLWRMGEQLVSRLL